MNNASAYWMNQYLKSKKNVKYCRREECAPTGPFDGWKYMTCCWLRQVTELQDAYFANSNTETVHFVFVILRVFPQQKKVKWKERSFFLISEKWEMWLRFSSLYTLFKKMTTDQHQKRRPFEQHKGVT